MDIVTSVVMLGIVTAAVLDIVTGVALDIVTAVVMLDIVTAVELEVVTALSDIGIVTALVSDASHSFKLDITSMRFIQIAVEISNYFGTNTKFPW